MVAASDVSLWTARKINGQRQALCTFTIRPDNRDDKAMYDVPILAPFQRSEPAIDIQLRQPATTEAGGGATPPQQLIAAGHDQAATMMMRGGWAYMIPTISNSSTGSSTRSARAVRAKSGMWDEPDLEPHTMDEALNKLRGQGVQCMLLKFRNQADPKEPNFILEAKRPPKLTQSKLDSSE